MAVNSRREHLQLFLAVVLIGTSTFGMGCLVGMAIAQPGPDEYRLSVEPVERHSTFDRRPSSQHGRAVYQALIELHAPPVEVNRSPVPESDPESPLVLGDWPRVSGAEGGVK